MNVDFYNIPTDDQLWIDEYSKRCIVEPVKTLPFVSLKVLFFTAFSDGCHYLLANKGLNRFNRVE